MMPLVDPTGAMPSLTLFTSIPDKAVRVDPAGRDIGAAHLRRCVASWVEAGHRVVSVNGPDEATRIAAQHPAVEVRPIERTALDKTGRPLIYLADLLRECASAPDALVGIVNADLYLHAPAALARLLAGADDHSLFYGQRLDVSDIGEPGEGCAYRSGLDCFFFAPAMVRDLPDEGFVIGETWWDYWLPLVLAKRGARLRPAAMPLVLHLQHDESTIANRSPTYMEYFHAFARSLTVRLPLPGNEPWDIQVRPLLAAFLRHNRSAATPVERIYLSQFLSLALSLYLAQDSELSTSFRRGWSALIDQADDADARRFVAQLLDTATALGAAAGRA
jgi:hypothetical protein